VNHLPPLILHPFADRSGPSKLLDSSRAHMAMRGMVEDDQRTQEDLVATFLEGRYTEIRMLFYVGKDVCRWIAQCIEQADRDPETRAMGLTFESVADYLINRPPQSVREKLQFWGVLDFRSIFIRAIGLNSVFSECPAREQLAHEFIRDYHRFADSFFRCRMAETDYARIDPETFDFTLFASGEYAKLLEEKWS
jgi:hypothetical protein